MNIFSSLPSTTSMLYQMNKNKETIANINSFCEQNVKSHIANSDIARLYDITDKNKIKIIEPLKKYCLKLLENKGEFGIAHIIFLKAVIESRSYKDAIEVLEWPFIQTGQLKSDEILQYLWYGGIIWTVLEQYEKAVQFFGFIERIERKDSNMKTDAKKKLTLISLLLGKHLSQHQYAAEYVGILQKLQNMEQLTKKQQQTLKEDGNLKLVNKLKDTLLLKELTNMSLIYNRIPISSLKQSFASPETISNLNKLQHTYRYDPRSQCVIFQGKKIDLQKSISRTVKSYLQIISQESNSKAESKQREWGF